MSDIPAPARPDPELAGHIATMVRRSAAVVRLEPALRNALARLGRQLRPDTSTDGVRVKLLNGQTDVRIDITIRPTDTATATAQNLARQTEQILTDHGLHAGRIEINILAIEYDGRTLSGTPEPNPNS
jgi:hypothetical protein